MKNNNPKELHKDFCNFVDKIKKQKTLNIKPELPFLKRIVQANVTSNNNTSDKENDVEYLYTNNSRQKAQTSEPHQKPLYNLDKTYNYNPLTRKTDSPKKREEKKYTIIVNNFSNSSSKTPGGRTK